MRSFESLLSLVGQPVASPNVQSVMATDGAISSTEPDLDEGETPRSHLSCPAIGYQLSHTAGRVNTLFVFLIPDDEFEAFQGTLKAGLSAASTRTDVQRELGKPTRSGEPKSHPILGRKGAWDRYDGDSSCLHFEYTEPEQRLRRITVMTVETAP